MLFRHLLSILILPTTVTVLVPYLIVRDRAPAVTFLTFAGGLVILAGLSLVVQTVRQFAKIGKGTLAPWDPTQNLVVVGMYRYVRNPMISGVLTILLGEALALSSTEILRWAGIFFLMNAVYIPLVEERGLISRFGEQYLEYRRNVSRWLPRLTPWQPPWSNNDERHS